MKFFPLADLRVLFFLVFFLAPTLVFSVNLEIFKDHEFIKEAIKNKQLPIVQTAKNDHDPSLPRTLDARWELLIFYANSPFFPRLIETFPDGKDFVLREAKRSPDLYMRLYEVLSDPLMNPLIGLPTPGQPSTSARVQNYGRFFIPQTDRSFFIHEDFDKQNLLRFPYTGFYFWYTSFLKTNKHPENLSFLKELLSVELDLPPEGHPQYQTGLIGRFLAPLVLGDIEFAFCTNYLLSLPHYDRAEAIYEGSPVYKALFPNYVPRRLLQVFTRTDLSLSDPSVPSDLCLQRALEKKESIDEADFAQLAQAQLFLSKCLSEKTEFALKKSFIAQATSVLDKLKKMPHLSHLCAIMLGDIQLGLYSPEHQNLPKAKKIFLSALQAESLPAIQNLLRVRLAELSLGLYSQDSPDIPVSLGYLKDNSYGAELLYGIRIGSFGPVGAHKEKAEALIWAHQHVAFFRLQAAVLALRQKNYAEALSILNKEQITSARYLLARLHSDSTQQFYDLDKALDLFLSLAPLDYRDSRARLLDISLKQDHPDKSLTMKQIKPLLESCDWTPESIHASLQALFLQETPQEPTTDEASGKEASAGEACSEEKNEADQDIERPSGDQGPQGQEEPSEERLMDHFLHNTQTNNFVPLPPDIENFLDQLHTSWSWTKLIPHLNRLGAQWSGRQTPFSPCGTQICFEGVPGIFIFHPPHNGQHTFRFIGYYRTLATMILQRAEIIRQQSLESVAL